MVTVPRPITGSIGSRIRVVLGNDGDEWLLLLNYDDGDTKWQSKDWKNIPHTVAKQINNCTAKDRNVKAVDFGADGAWFVRGVKSDGTGGHCWWGGTSGSAQLSEWCDSPPVHASFGSSVYGAETYAIIQGNNGYALSGNLHDDLSDRLKRIHSRSKTIHFVRLFSSGQYLISDQEGLEWRLHNEHITNELQRNQNGAVKDIALAGDGSWVIIRDNNFVSSTGLDERLKSALSRFYSEQRRYGNQRSAEIREAKATNERERLERERAAQEAREAAERAEREREAAEREERERVQRETAEREERERIRREAERAEREEREAIEAAAAAQLNAATRISSLEAALEKRLIEEAKDIKDTEEKLRNRKRSFQETIQSMPPDAQSRINLDNETSTTTTSTSSDNSNNTCVICHDGVSTMAVIPCGHVCLCNRCSDVCMSGQNQNGQRQRSCPLCRGNMQSVLRIYLGN